MNSEYSSNRIILFKNVCGAFYNWVDRSEFEKKNISAVGLFTKAYVCVVGNVCGWNCARQTDYMNNKLRR